MRQKRLPRSQHYFSLVEQNATMKPHGIACILEVNIIRAQNVISNNVNARFGLKSTLLELGWMSRRVHLQTNVEEV